jgi:hypothetical protein
MVVDVEVVQLLEFEEVLADEEDPSPSTSSKSKRSLFANTSKESNTSIC